MLLQNGLADVISDEAANGKRIVDLFCGSATVSWFAALDLHKRVLACDLQKFATVLAGAVVSRKKVLDSDLLAKTWLADAEAARSRYVAWEDAAGFDHQPNKDANWHREAQEFCQSGDPSGGQLIFTSYGGHYFSPTQALSLDSMLATLPGDSEERLVCLAATIVAASKCAAAPGHTAQPFKATASGFQYLREAWSRDAFGFAARGLRKIAPLAAKQRGETLVGDANEIAERVEPTDLVFVDPPYSAVQYSRFYHVLETVARGSCGTVDGVGRYPPQTERPRSQYSQRSKSAKATTDLLRKLSERRCKVILTFPLGTCSNGMSGEWIEATASRYFKVSRRTVWSRFSTLGGNTTNREARQVAEELILVLTA